jgi:MFS transporter, DHA2 family, multidrug resistance protein
MGRFTCCRSNLSQIQGYNAEQVGMVLAWTGLPQLVLIPCVPFLMRHIDTRFLVAAGFGLFALSCFLNLEITPDYAGDQLFVPNLVRAVGQALVLTPLSALATVGIERENAGSALAMFNMMRNLGGSIGIAVLETFVAKREQFHSSIITAHVSLLDEASRQRIASLQAHFLASGTSNSGTAWHEAVVQIGRTVRAQSYLLAYSDAFYLMGAALLLALATSVAMRKSSGGGAGHTERQRADSRDWPTLRQQQDANGEVPGGIAGPPEAAALDDRRVPRGTPRRDIAARHRIPSHLGWFWAFDTVFKVGLDANA